jgi:hypothetical protein
MVQKSAHGVGNLYNGGLMRLPALIIAAACTALPGAAPEGASPTTLPAEQQALLDKWFEAVGPRRPKENFGELVARAGMVQLGKPYNNPPDKPGPETLRVELSSFDCVTFVESTLTVARCTWLGTRDTTCFLRELEEWRYRGGKLEDFASRLHYFSDWLADNGSRGRLHPLTGELGGAPASEDLTWITKHPERYPAMADPAVQQQIATIEARLSAVPQPILMKEQIAGIEGRLADGDVIAFVGDKPGLVVTHTGFVHRGKDGVARVLHASSYHGRIILTPASLSNYVGRRAERKGLALSRPIAPDATAVATSQ